MKGLILLFIINVIACCDYTRPFFINETKGLYPITTECGRVDIGGSSLRYMVLFACIFHGNYTVNADSLMMVSLAGDTIPTAEILLNDKVPNTRVFDVREGDFVNLWFTMYYDYEVERIVKLHPSSFLTCEGKPLITDTLYIRLSH